MKNTVAEIVVGLPVEGPFDYLIPEEWQDRLAVGQRVSVVFAHVKRLGFVVGIKTDTAIKNVKAITAVLDGQPWFNGPLLELAGMMRDRYGCTSGEALEIMLPKSLRTTRSLDLTWDQDQTVLRNPERIWISSQNTRDHWASIQKKVGEVIAGARGVIVLVADSSQIPYVHEQLKAVLPADTIIHDNERTAKQELEGWSSLRSGRIRAIIGLRSAVFAPVDPLGLIVMYDEDNPSYREEQSPFYQAREVVMMRSKAQACSVIIVAFAPSVEMVYHSGEQLARLDFPDEKKARRQLIDMTNFESKGPMMISFPLRNSLQRVLGAGGRVMIVINRRGHSTVTRCLFCGHMMRCGRCTTNLSYSSVKKKLECRRCGALQDLPKTCPHCGKNYLKSWGVGVERIAQEIRRLFPFAKTEQLDREVAVFPAKFDVLVTTQAVLRMLGRVTVDTVGILDIDSEFNRGDYRSSQKAFSLLTHLSLMAKNSIEIQTFHADNDVLKFFVAGKDREFYANELLLRKELNLPPYYHWVLVVIRGKEEKAVTEQAQALYNSMAANKPHDIEVLNVRPDVVPKVRDQYRMAIFVRGPQACEVLAFAKESVGKLKKKSSVIITVQVDP